ncbi:MAG: sodium-dependent bicarbonate transport family permease [Sphingomonadales bacterium]
MNLQFLSHDLSNPTILFFLLGIFAVIIKSDLEIPESSFKFISLYLLFSIGFRGGQELQHSPFNAEIVWSLCFGVTIAALIPIYTFYLIRKRVGISNAAAIAAAYGSVSAVTFVAALSFLELHNLKFNGHMVAVMAFMEAPAIIVGVLLLRIYDNNDTRLSLRELLRHSLANGSVLMIMGSLVIGLLSDSKQAADIAPFTTDIFKGFLALFLLEMGMTTARRIKSFKMHGWAMALFALLIPALNGIVVAWLSQFVTDDVANRFVFAVLAASASYIAVPAAMRRAAPNADPGLYIPMALGLTFPFNIALGMPLYYAIISLS